MKIRTKNPHFTGTRAGIAFVDGVGETSDERSVAQLRRLGYTVEDETDEPKGAEEPKGSGDEQEDSAPAGNASRDDWAAYAKSLGFDVLDEWKRDDIKALFQGEPEQD